MLRKRTSRVAQSKKKQLLAKAERINVVLQGEHAKWNTKRTQDEHIMLVFRSKRQIIGVFVSEVYCIHMFIVLISVMCY